MQVLSPNVKIQKENQKLLRGQYTKTSQEQKNRIVNYALKTGNLSWTSNIFSISQKNIRRWIDKVKSEYSLAYQEVEKHLWIYIQDYQKQNLRHPLEEELETKAREIFSQKENQRFNKIWFKDFLKKFKETIQTGSPILTQLRPVQMKPIYLESEHSSNWIKNNKK